MTIFEQGFIDKCAEAGVDPDFLVKLAQGTNVLGKVTGGAKDYSGIADTVAAPNQKPVPKNYVHPASPASKPLKPAEQQAKDNRDKLRKLNPR
jgi:hypothetical protein